jgi:DNA-binding LacI/PurR family transcriptional regulator
MPITAKDIARELNLSQPTVSRILSGDARHRVSPDTRQRVLEAARRLKYQPNALARSLRQGCTNVIGLYTNHDYDVRNDFLGTLIGGLQRSCEREGLDLLLHSALHQASPDDIYGKLRNGRIDGLILHTMNGDPLIERLGGSPLPVVAVADRLPNLPSVTCDDADGMRQLIGYLRGRGHRRFVFLAPHETLTSVARRREGFEAALADLPAADRKVVMIEAETPDSAFEALVAGGPAVVCCWNDRTAYNLLHLCDRRGVRVPDTLAVAGFDGFLATKIPKWHLVTVHCPWEAVAAAALTALRKMLAGITPDEEMCLPVTLLTGDTA